MGRDQRVKMAAFGAVGFAANGVGCVCLALTVAPWFFLWVAVCAAVAGWLTLEAIASARGVGRRA